MTREQELQKIRNQKPEAVAKRSEWAKANRDKANAATRRYYQKNKEKIAEYRGRPENRERARQASRDWYQRNRDRAAKMTSIRQLAAFGLTPEDYDRMLSLQGGSCAICGGSPDRSGRCQRFFVDHDHRCCPDRAKSCGQCVRGLLCSACNSALGLFGDDPDRLRSALDYLASGAVNSS